MWLCVLVNVDVKFIYKMECLVFLLNWDFFKGFWDIVLVE